jgi:hypothetical protein
MKRVINFLIVGLILISAPLFAQKPTDDRMKRDIAVMETALSEMIKQELDQRNFFFVDIKGNYVSGYGVTFTVPTSMLTSVWSTGGNELTVVDGNVIRSGGAGFSYSYSEELPDVAVTEKEAQEAKKAMEKAGREDKNAQKERSKTERESQVSRNKAEREMLEAREAERVAHGATVYGLQSTNGALAYAPRSNRKRVNSDSLNTVNNAKIIEAAKTFIADYGDMLSQLAPSERIVVTNRGNNDTHVWYFGQKAKRSLLSVEATKSDLTQFRQGSITRDQLLKKMKVVNTVTSEKTEPDMELLASIFNRLYREDLSRTYYMQGGAYYERLTDFGVILHMQVVSSTSNGDYYIPAKDVRLVMPTQGLTNLTQEERDKKVKELYPVFESELKENILDYGRTLKSLNDNEQLIVDVSMTKCTGCGIPASLELSVKASVLKDYNAGKLDKSGALSKIEVKKGPNQ